MKNKLLFFAFVLVSFVSNAQADLTINAGYSFSPISVQSSDLLTITCSVKNQGTATSKLCHVHLWLSDGTSPFNEVFGIDVSLEKITPSNSSKLITAQISISNSLPSGTYYVCYWIDSRAESGEVNTGNNSYYKSTPLTITQTSNREQNIPYPILFIHGLNDDDNCWSALKTVANKGPGFAKTLRDNFGWSAGGNMNFCLNYDADYTTSNVFNTTKPNDFHDFTVEANMKKADYYFVNFDVDASGNPYNSTIGVNNGDWNYESNQAGITKQGMAIAYAVYHILNVTGRDKVILVGHSMGGLAGRDYLQNWKQADQKHHIAKYFSNGTPHAGVMPNTIDPAFVSSVDWDSEAMRDLANKYSNNVQGLYLLGGVEDPSQLYTFSPFYNADANCNGQEYDNVTGLNYTNLLPLPTDVYYTNAVGTGANFGGDGCVDEWSASFHTQYLNLNVPSDTIIIKKPAGGFSAGTILHQYLPSTQFAEANTRGLDEPNVQPLAYEVFANTYYFGNTTKKSNWWTLPFTNDADHDWYKIDVPSSGIIDLQVYNIPVFKMNALFYDQSVSLISNAYNNGEANISSQIIANQAGTYYFDLQGDSVDDYSWKNPYVFSLTFSSTTSSQEFANKISDITNYPNPFHDKTTISFTLLEQDKISINVYNSLGEVVSTLADQEMNEGKHTFEFDGSNLSAGVYYYIIQSDNIFLSTKIVLEK